jgi:Tfp pilus assembly protein PilZ
MGKENKENPADRRKHERVHTRIEIPYWKYVKLKHKEDVNIGFVKNMSRGGFLLETEVVYPQGEEMGFEFYLPNSPKAISGRAEVRWSRAPQEAGSGSTNAEIPGMGLEFRTFDEGCEAILEDFIQKELAKK